MAHARRPLRGHPLPFLSDCDEEFVAVVGEGDHQAFTRASRSRTSSSSAVFIWATTPGLSMATRSASESAASSTYQASRAANLCSFEPPTKTGGVAPYGSGEPGRATNPTLGN